MKEETFHIVVPAMIAVLILMITGIESCNILPPNVQCSDSDGGLDINVAGTTTAGSTSMKDYCINDNTLMEYYCSGSAVANDVETCDNGCQNGACVSGNLTELQTCSEQGGTICEHGIECSVPMITASDSNYCCTGTCGVTQTCTDSDDGEDYFMQGTTVQGKDTFTDYCDGNTVYEGYCNDDGNIATSSYDCPDGCSDGACSG